MDDLKLYGNNEKETESIASTRTRIRQRLQKNLGILEANGIVSTEMKDKIWKEYCFSTSR